MAPIPTYSQKTNIWIFSFPYHPHPVHQQNTSQIHPLLPNAPPPPSSIPGSCLQWSPGEAPQLSTLFSCSLKFTLCTAARMMYQQQIRSYHSPTCHLPRASQCTITQCQIEILFPTLQRPVKSTPQLSLKSNPRLFASAILAFFLSPFPSVLAIGLHLESSLPRCSWGWLILA